MSAKTSPEALKLATRYRKEHRLTQAQQIYQQILKQLDIPEAELIALCDRHKFETMTQGRPQGSENINRHYRKGIAGDWKNHFDSFTLNYFHQVTGNLVEILGYQE